MNIVLNGKKITVNNGERIEFSNGNFITLGNTIRIETSQPAHSPSIDALQINSTPHSNSRAKPSPKLPKNEIIKINNLFFHVVNGKLQPQTKKELEDLLEMEYNVYDIPDEYPISDWDVSLIKDMSFLFRPYGTYGLQEINVDYYEQLERVFPDISKWDVSHVVNMEGMFMEVGSRYLGVSNWDVSKVENMKNMFYRCVNFNETLNNWNVSNVKNMSGMFYHCVNLGYDEDESDISFRNWDVSSVTNMDEMFLGCDNFTEKLDWYIVHPALLKKPPINMFSPKYPHKNEGIGMLFTNYEAFVKKRKHIITEKNIKERKNLLRAKEGIQLNENSTKKELYLFDPYNVKEVASYLGGKRNKTRKIKNKH